MINGQTTATLYDGWNPVQLQAGGVAVENRLTGLGLDANFARTRSGVTESYLSDALGSTVELRDAAQNQTVAYTYDPFGNTASSSASTNGIKYTGREQDLEDLYYYRNRYYKPSVGRFISEDPIGLAGGSNLYAYVGNDPINWVDDDGQRRGRTPRGRDNDGRGRDNGGSEPWPKDDKNFCIRTYVNCQNYGWTGNCQACFDRCIGSESGDWPFDMCRPPRKNSCP